MYKDLLNTVIQEFELLESKYETEKSVHWRRVMVRSTFAAIEAISNSMMYVTLPKAVSQLNKRKELWWKSDPESASKEFFEICALSNLTYEINEKGEIDIKPLKVNFSRQVLFAIKKMSKVQGVIFNPKEIDGWIEFGKAIRIRDRVTHPKKSEDLDVSEEELKIVKSGLAWLMYCNHIATGQ